MWAQSDIEEWEDSDGILIAARPIPEPDLTEAPTDNIWIDAWSDIWSRSDDLAAQCVKETHGWGKGRHLPFSTNIQVYPSHNATATKWIHTLEKASWRAEFTRLGASKEDDLFRDPATGLPVYRPEHDDRYFAALPHRLPAESSLHSVILDDDVWIRTFDGSVYLAPGGEGINATWGYGGRGPSYLASLINCLLDDINSSAFDALDERRETPDGLYELVRIKHENGTVLDRRLLEEAKRSQGSESRIS
ncbi:hypothetical protein GCM10017559_49410 [Streptosporangium longisporum]|uniref:Uncharacterized protein n=1 Tax=Streptosporangium longisporum TaxID=46187 RepID=A0ABN3YC66_9ACTN